MAEKCQFLSWFSEFRPTPSNGLPAVYALRAVTVIRFKFPPISASPLEFE